MDKSFKAGTQAPLIAINCKQKHLLFLVLSGLRINFNSVWFVLLYFTLLFFSCYSWKSFPVLTLMTHIKITTYSFKSTNMTEVSLVTCLWLNLIHSVWMLQAQSMPSGQSLPKRNHKIKRGNKLHYFPYEKFYDMMQLKRSPKAYCI